MRERKREKREGEREGEGGREKCLNWMVIGARSLVLIPVSAIRLIYESSFLDKTIFRS